MLPHTNMHVVTMCGTINVQNIVLFMFIPFNPSWGSKINVSFSADIDELSTLSNSFLTFSELCYSRYKEQLLGTLK